MKIVCVSDTHNQHRGLEIPEGDVLIHAGDATYQGLSHEVEDFLAWFASQPHPFKILIAGNHDWLFQRHPAFCDWAFNLARKGRALREAWNRIPMDTDILVTHGPAYGILDQVAPEPPGGWHPDAIQPEHLGCEELLIRVRTIKPRLHVCGHIHGGYGIRKDKETTHVNASICDEGYRPVNAPIVLDLKNPKRSS
jgi:predicted phosphodiesterase